MEKSVEQEAEMANNCCMERGVAVKRCKSVKPARSHHHTGLVMDNCYSQMVDELDAVKNQSKYKNPSSDPGLHHASLAVVNSRYSPVCGLGSSSLLLRARQGRDANEESFMQDSVDFQWCMEHEEEYQREMISSRNAPRSIFEGSLLDSRKAYCCNHNLNNYEVIARNIDANLAQIDMENFKSEDINSILALPDMLEQEAASVQQEAGEECASVTDSLLGDIDYASNSGSHHDSDGGALLPQDWAIFSTEKPFDVDEKVSYSQYRKANDESERREKTTTTATGISIDSLDMSSLGDNTNDVVMRCTEQDKTRYTIAFEESLSSVTTFTDSNTDEEEKRDVNDAKDNERRREQLVRSEHSYITWNRLQKDSINICRRRNKENVSEDGIGDGDEVDTATATITTRGTKQSKSLPNIINVADLHGRLDYGMIPLFDLNCSQFPSSGSEMSGPRALVRRFFQNHVSASSSAQTSPSYSYDSQSQESASGRSLFTSPTNKSYSLNNTALRVIREANNNESYENGNGQYITGLDEDQNSFEDSLIVNESSALPLPKTSYNRLKQASPIKEEEEPLSDSSRADVTMKSETDEQSSIQQHNGRDIETALYHANYQTNGSTAPRSSSVDRFVNPPNLAYNPRHSSDGGGNGVYNVNRPVRVNHQFSKECSPSSSGYVSSRQGSFEWFRKAYSAAMKPKSNGNGVSFTTTRTASTQVPVHIQDKQVQTSLITSKSMEFILKDESASCVTDKEIPLRRGKYAYMDEKPFYVCYPNYSLPDLSFLGDLGSGGISENQKINKVYLSPTKLKLSSREVPPVRPGLSPKKGVRPKSCNDYETLTQQNFSHIKDWDSLKVLLPNEFKTLIERLNGIQRTQDKVNPSMSSQISGVRLRSPQKRLLRKTYSNEQDPGCRCKNTKRFSLQEQSSKEPALGFGPETSPVRKKTMSKSATMPPCHCFCQWHHSHCCSCYHHCCHKTHCAPPHCLSPTKPPVVPAIPVEPVDELSEMISLEMTLKEVTNIIGGHAGRTVSPSKPCEPISEQDEVDGRCSKKLNEDSSSFKELQKHWESLANTPGHTAKGAAQASKSKSSTPEPYLEEDICRNVGSAKPKIPAKPAQCVKRQANQAAGKQAARPTSLNTHNFKSMIPIPKGSKSPPGAKISPTTGAVN